MPSPGLFRDELNRIWFVWVRSPFASDSRVSSFHTMFPESDPCAIEFSVNWYEPETEPGYVAAFGLQIGVPIWFDVAWIPVAQDSICESAPMIELPLSCESSFGPFAHNIASRVGGF